MELIHTDSREFHMEANGLKKEIIDEKKLCYMYK